jgi:molecular chaperone DnaK (HSP70)
LNVLRILNEPTAAAMAYGLQEKIKVIIEKYNKEMGCQIFQKYEQ